MPYFVFVLAILHTHTRILISDNIICIWKLKMHFLHKFFFFFFFLFLLNLPYFVFVLAILHTHTRILISDNIICIWKLKMHFLHKFFFFFFAPTLSFFASMRALFYTMTAATIDRCFFVCLLQVLLRRRCCVGCSTEAATPPQPSTSVGNMEAVDRLENL